MNEFGKALYISRAMVLGNLLSKKGLILLMVAPAFVLGAGALFDSRQPVVALSSSVDPAVAGRLASAEGVRVLETADDRAIVALRAGMVDAVVRDAAGVPQVVLRGNGEESEQRLATGLASVLEGKTDRPLERPASGPLLVGLLLLTGFASALARGSDIVLARERGCEARMLASSSTRTTLVLSDLLARAALATVQMSAIVLVATVLGHSFGDPAKVLLLIVAFAIAAGAAAQLLGRLCRTREHVSASAPIVALIAALIGGSFPEFVNVSSDRILGSIVRLPVPHAWASDGLRSVADRSSAVPAAEAAALVLLGSVFCAASGLLLRRQQHT